MVIVEIPLLVIFSQLWLYSAQRLETSPPSPVYAAVHTKLVLNCSTVNKSDSITWQWTSSLNHNSYSTITNNKSMTSLVIDRVNYFDEGVYVCRAVNQTSGLVVEQTSIIVSVGDPPPIPSSPTLNHACGYPPSEFIMSYQYTTSPTTHHPLTVELITASLEAYLFGGSDIKVVEESRRVIRRPGKWSFRVNIADVIKDFRPRFPYCNDTVFDCTTMCTFVRVRNVFGQSVSNTTITRVEETCGKVADFRAIDVGRNSLTLGWGLPKCLRTSKQWYIKVNYYIRCEPTCGQIQTTRDVEVITGLNYTIKSLMPYTNYRLYVSCSFTRDPADAGKPISISVQTKEDTPRAPPIIETLRWLSEPVACTEPNGSAVFSWKVNKESLFGKVRYYIITHQAANSSSKTTRIVPADVNRLVLSGLQMDKSYRFSAAVCTGGGCSHARYHSLSSFPCTASDTSPERLNVYPYWIWIVIGAAAAVLVFLMAVGYAVRRRGRVDLHRPVLPTDGIYPTAVVYPHQEEPIDRDYARADVFSSSPNEGTPQELRISTTCLSRSSSVLTCNTEI